MLRSKIQAAAGEGGSCTAELGKAAASIMREWQSRSETNSVGESDTTCSGQGGCYGRGLTTKNFWDTLEITRNIKSEKTEDN